METKADYPVIPLEPCESQKIHSFGYDPSLKILAVRFIDYKKGAAPKAPGPLYHYPEVELEVFEAMKAAPSVGKFFIAQIQPRKAYTRIDETGTGTTAT